MDGSQVQQEKQTNWGYRGRVIATMGVEIGWVAQDVSRPII